MTYKPKISHDTALLDVSSGDHHAKTGDNEVKGLVLVDTAANRPAASISGRWFIASDTLAISYDDGAAWTTVGTLGGEDVSDYSTHKGTSDAHHTKTTQRVDASIPQLLEDTSANIPAAGTEGRIFFESDTGLIKYDDGASWVTIGVSDHTQLSGITSGQHHTKTGDDEVYGLVRYQSAAPTGASEKVYWDSDNDLLYIYDGAAWVEHATGAGGAPADDPIKTVNQGWITLGAGETFEFWKASLPAGKQIKVIEAGIAPSGVTDLTIEVYNHTDAVLIYSNYLSYDDGSYSTPLASGGTGDSIGIRLNNASASTYNMSGWVTFVVE